MSTVSPARPGPTAPFREKRAALFDMGGVLLDLGGHRGLPSAEFDREGRRLLLQALAASGAQANESDLDRLIFEPWRSEYRKRYERQREAALEPHFEALRKATRTSLEGTELLDLWTRPYVESLTMIESPEASLKALREAGVKLAIVSNVPTPGRLYRQALDRLGLDELFDAHCFSYDVGARKPGPELLWAALERLGVPASEAVMIGDRPAADVAAGRAAGCTTVWLTLGPADEPPADHSVDSLDELPALFGLPHQLGSDSQTSPEGL